jgi:hypothetical protein
LAFDYSGLAATAQELVTEFGKAVTLRRLDTVPPNPSEPWVPPADPRAGATTLAVTAVFVEPSSLQNLGGPNTQLDDWVRRSQQIAIVAAPEDLSSFSELIDGADLWRVVGCSTLNPGGTRILHYVGLAR